MRAIFSNRQLKRKKYESPKENREEKRELKSWRDANCNIGKTKEDCFVIFWPKVHFYFYFEIKKFGLSVTRQDKKCFQVQRERIKFHSWGLNMKTKSFCFVSLKKKIIPESEFQI